MTAVDNPNRIAFSKEVADLLMPYGSAAWVTGEINPTGVGEFQDRPDYRTLSSFSSAVVNYFDSSFDGMEIRDRLIEALQYYLYYAEQVKIVARGPAYDRIVVIMTQLLEEQTTGNMSEDLVNKILGLKNEASQMLR